LFGGSHGATGIGQFDFYFTGSSERSGGVEGYGDIDRAAGLEDVDRLGVNVADENLGQDGEADGAADAAGQKVVHRTVTLGAPGGGGALPAGIDGNVKNIVTVLEPLGQLVLERKIAADMFGEGDAVEHRLGPDHDAVEFQKHPAVRQFGKGEMAAVKPDTFPGSRVPILPGKFGHAMRQRDFGHGGIIRLGDKCGGVEFSAEQPILIEGDEQAGRAVGRGGLGEAGACEKGSGSERDRAQGATA